MKDFGELLNQAGAMQARLKEIQNRIAALEVEGVSGGGMVRIALNGKGYCKSVAVERQLLDPADGEVLEDLIAAAINDAKSKLDEQTQQEMRKLTDGLPLPPGLQLPF